MQNSLSIANTKIAELKQILPEVFAEGKIDSEKLRATLGEHIDFRNERYVLNWAGKSEAFRILQEPTTQTLVPCKEESVDFDTTENLFIEGENLEVLKVLQKSYFGKIKMIYIDPPYNTGNDSFIYPDKFSETKEEYLQRVGDKDEEGTLTREGLFRKNSKENGQYHSNWLNMMMPRLFLAKNLLRQDGVIFVSIDDNEVHNLRLLMNEIFGEENFVGQFIVNSTPNGRDYGHISKMHEYILFYSKNIDLIDSNLLPDEDKTFKYTDSTSGYNIHPLYNSNVAFNKHNRPNLYYPFYVEPKSNSKEEFLKISLTKQNGWIEVFPPLSIKDNVPFVWRWGKEKSLLNINQEIVGYCTNEGEYRIVQKMRHSEKIIRSILSDKKYSSRRGTAETEEILENKIFSFPKPINLIKDLVFIATDKDSIILDFFAGSGTTAHAVMQLNAEDGGKRKFICVQMPELCDEKSEAHKAGYHTIAEISKERIRRAGKKIVQEKESETQKKKVALNFPENSIIQNIDLGFKAMKLTESNFKQWRKIKDNDISALENQMEMFVDKISEHSTPENMVYELLLKSGKDLNSKIEHKNKAYIINDNELVFILEEFSAPILESVIALNPQKVIALDRIFCDNDQLKTNTVLSFKDAGIKFETV